jgi:peptidoglycan hydrolase FlgJ
MIEKSDAHQAATQLEGYFLRRILSEVRSSGGGMLDGGFAGETFREMMDGALADAMASGGGVGLAPLVEQQLETQAGPPQAHGHGHAQPQPAPAASGDAAAAHKVTVNASGTYTIKPLKVAP